MNYRSAVLLLALAACRRAEPAAPTTAQAPAAAQASAIAAAPRSPLSQSELPTTDGAIAINNLEAQIESHETTLANHPDNLIAARSLVPLYLARGQFLGRLADYDRAEQLAEQLVRAAPKEASSYQLRASVRSTFHRFREALADLDELDRLRGEGSTTAWRASIWQATGHPEEALRIRKREAEQSPSVRSLGALAGLLGDMGELQAAEEQFARAQHQLRNVSPLELAWLYLQQATLWQKMGRLGRARELLEAAHERVPAYAPVVGHLAQVLQASGERRRALALLEPLVTVSDDPEYAGQLAGLQRELGKQGEADRMRERARSRYQELLASHPDAFAEHAARFFLGEGGDAAKAFELAERNLRLRTTPDAYQLAIEAALAGRANKRACELAERSLQASPAPAALRVVCARAFTSCGEPARAEAELRMASRSGRD